MSNEFRWVALYSDGELVHGDAESSPLALDRSRLCEFVLLRMESGLTVNRFSLRLTTDRKLVFRRRTRVLPTGESCTLYLIGWNTKQGLTLMYINENGGIELDDDRNNLELFDCEKF